MLSQGNDNQNWVKLISSLTLKRTLSEFTKLGHVSSTGVIYIKAYTPKIPASELTSRFYGGHNTCGWKWHSKWNTLTMPCSLSFQEFPEQTSQNIAQDLFALLIPDSTKSCGVYIWTQKCKPELWTAVVASSRVWFGVKLHLHGDPALGVRKAAHSGWFIIRTKSISFPFDIHINEVNACIMQPFRPKLVLAFCIWDLLWALTETYIPVNASYRQHGIGQTNKSHACCFF